MKECKFCGAKMNNKAKFCPECGEEALDLPTIEKKNYSFLRNAVKEYYQEITKGIDPDYFTFATRTITIKDQNAESITITNFPQIAWKYNFYKNKEEVPKLIKNMIKFNKLHKENGVCVHVELPNHNYSTPVLVTIYHSDEPKEFITVEREPIWISYEDFKTYVPLINPADLDEFILALSNSIKREEEYIKNGKKKLSSLKKVLKEIQILDKKYGEERIKQEKKEEIASFKQEAKVSPNQITLDELLEEAEE